MVSAAQYLVCHQEQFGDTRQAVTQTQVRAPTGMCTRPRDLGDIVPGGLNGRGCFSG
jgi:hypothetical protein